MSETDELKALREIQYVQVIYILPFLMYCLWFTIILQRLLLKYGWALAALFHYNADTIRAMVLYVADGSYMKMNE